ncbi:hypothetical protein T484DRAFT_1887858, partial [Baffinella frigidus]
MGCQSTPMTFFLCALALVAGLSPATGFISPMTGMMRPWPVARLTGRIPLSMQMSGAPPEKGGSKEPDELPASSPVRDSSRRSVRPRSRPYLASVGLRRDAAGGRVLRRGRAGSEEDDRKFKMRMLVLGTAMLYGTNFGCVKILQETLDVPLAAALRFSIAGVAMV